MRKQIVAAVVVAAPLLALGSPQATACWERGYGYGYSSAAYYGGGVGVRRVGYRAVGWRSGYGYRAIGVGRVGIGRRRW